MRKGLTSDQAVTDDILDRSQTIWLALNDADGPYCVPVSFAHQGNTLFIHSSAKGRKFDALAGGSSLSFSCAVDMEPKHGDKACSFGYRFKSVVGFGRPRRLEGEDARHALEAIVRKFAGQDLPMEHKAVAATAVFAIDMTSVTARLKD